MISSVTFGNKYISESSIIIEKEARKVAAELAENLTKKGNSVATAAKSSELPHTYYSPFTNYAADCKLPTDSIAEASYAISHSPTECKNLDIICK